MIHSLNTARAIGLAFLSLFLVSCESTSDEEAINTTSYAQRIGIIEDLSQLIRGSDSIQIKRNATTVEFLGARLDVIGRDLLPVTTDVSFQLKDESNTNPARGSALSLALALNRVYSYELNPNILLDNGHVLWDDYKQIVNTSSCASADVRPGSRDAQRGCNAINDARVKLKKFEATTESGNFLVTGLVAPRGNLLWHHRTSGEETNQVSYSYAFLPVYRPWLNSSVLSLGSKRNNTQKYYVGFLVLVCIPEIGSTGIPPCLRRGSEVTRSRLAGYGLVSYSEK